MMSKRISTFFILLIILSCGKAKETESNNYLIKQIANDSVSFLVNKKNNLITCVYSFSNRNEKQLKEKIEFFSNGQIDYSKSTFLKRKGNDLYFYSQYSKQYPIPKKRYVEFTSKSDTVFFREKGEIKNYKKVLSNRGKIIETIFLDSIVKVQNNEKQKIIRTLEYQIDLNDLLFDKIKTFKVNE